MIKLLVLAQIFLGTFAQAKSANQVWIMPSSGNKPIWGAVDISSSAASTGVLPVTRGGTGAATLSAFQAAALPSMSGQNGKILSNNGSNAQWITGGGGIASVSADPSPTLGGNLNLSTFSILQDGVYIRDTAFTSYLLQSGGTIVLSGNSGSSQVQLDSGGATYTSGSTHIFNGTGVQMNAPLSMQFSNKITNLANGTASADAVNKSQLDTAVPSQTGNSGRFLTTNGSSTSWGTLNTFDAVMYNGRTIPLYPLSGSTAGSFLGGLSSAARANSSDISSDNRFYCQTSNLSPFIQIGTMSMSTGTTTQLANPATIPTGTANGCKFSNDGRYLAVVLTVTPFLMVYERSGTTFTKLADPVTLPPSNSTDLVWAKDDSFIMLTHGTTPFVSRYNLLGAVLTNTTLTVGTPPTGAATGIALNPANTRVAIANSVSPFFQVYTITGSTLTKLSNPVTLPTGAVGKLAYNPTGDILAVPSSATPFILLYNETGSLSKRSDPASLPSGGQESVAYTGDGNAMITVGTAGVGGYYSISSGVYTFSPMLNTVVPSAKYVSISKDQRMYCCSIFLNGIGTTCSDLTTSRPAVEGKMAKILFRYGEQSQW